MANEPLQYETPAAAQEGWTKHEVASLALKLFGIYALLRALPLLGYLPLIVTTTPTDSMTMAAWISIHLLWAAVAGVLLLMSNRLAWLLLSQPRGATMDMPPSGELQAISFSIVGVILIVFGLTGLTRSLVYAMVQGVQADAFRVDWGLLAQGVVQLALGVVLFVQARALAVLWHKLRTAGAVKD